MNRIIVAIAFAASACATTTGTYQEASQCPTRMTNEQRLSGIIRCRALCSSDGKDMEAYDTDCNCWCRP